MTTRPHTTVAHRTTSQTWYRRRRCDRGSQLATEYRQCRWRRGGGRARVARRGRRRWPCARPDLHLFRDARFDPAAEPSLTGRLTETIRTWPGAHRSWHPTHSAAAIGAGADDLVEGHHLRAACGFGSPMDRVAARNGWVLLIGVGHNTNSTIHVGEVHAAAPLPRRSVFRRQPA